MELGDTYQGFAESLSRAFEMAVTPAVFGLAGYGLDRWWGTLPVMTVILSVLAIVGMLIRMCVGYSLRMQEQEAVGPWAPRPIHRAQRRETGSV